MKGSLGHLQLNVSDSKLSFPFYKDMLSFLGYTILMEDSYGIGFSGDGCGIWVMQAEPKFKGNKFHRKNPGVNHLCFKVEKREDVDNFYNGFLVPRGIKTLYDSPKGYPEYTPDYYALFIEDPDRLKVEIAYY